MRTKFKDAAEVIAYKAATFLAIAEAASLYDQDVLAHQATSRNLTQSSERYRLAREEGAHAELMVDRLVLPDDMRETQSKGEWIIEINNSRYDGHLVKTSIGCTLVRSEAKRFTSEEEAADFSADHWKGFQPKVVPYEATDETK